jgi:hypothetical protein
MGQLVAPDDGGIGFTEVGCGWMVWFDVRESMIDLSNGENCLDLPVARD